MSTGFHTVHVRVNDAATGQATPCRIRFTGADGTYYAPFGRLTEFPTGQGEDVGGNLEYQGTRFAYIDGSCEISLPAGSLTVEISKGLEYVPLRREFTLVPGKLALRFALERWINLRAEGWYSGDGRAHFLSPHAALLEGAAEDLAVVNLLAGEFTRHSKEAGKEYRTIPNMLAFSGQRPAFEIPGHLVVVNTYNQHPVLGRLGLLNCHRPVFPLSFGGSAGPDNWTLADWCDQCHRKGGLVVWCEGCIGPPEAKDWQAESEALADLILGKVDALESFTLLWGGTYDQEYVLWNAGLRVPLIGASGKDDNLINLGFVRTYAHLQPAEFTYQDWIEAIRAGRTFVTNGPLLRFTVNGQEPGSVVDLSEPDSPVHVHAEARGFLPFERLEIVANGKVAARADVATSPPTAVLDAEVFLPDGGWIAARCSGPHWWEGRIHVGKIAAHSSPVYVRLPGQPQRSDPDAVRYLSGLLDRGMEWVRSQGHYENDRQRENLAVIFRNASATLAQRTKRC